MRPRPDSRAGLLLTVALAGIAGVVFWHSPVLYPLKLLTVVFHEAGHALATYLVGGSVDAISINAYQGGVTHCRIPPGWWRNVVVSSAGYLGSAVFGTALLRGAARPAPWGGPRAMLWLLGGGLLLLALLFFRDLFSWGFAIPTAAVLLGLARWGPLGLIRPVVVFLSSFTCLYALFDLRDDVLRLPWEARVDGRTDAQALAELLGLPALFWGVLWSVAAVWLVVWTLRALAADEAPTGPLEPS